jgi:hypothetical protein
MWSQDIRHGVGTLYCPSGSIFVGTYMQDKRQGLGVTYWAGRCKKYVAEYVDDMATTGCMMELDDEAVEVPATEQLREAIAAARVRAAGAAARTAAVGDQTAAQLPELKLIQPSKVRWTEQIDQSINQCYICSNEVHREFMPAIHRKSLIWLIMTCSTSSPFMMLLQKSVAL